MRRILTVAVVLVGFPAALAHASYVPAKSHACRSGYVAKTVKVRKHERKHGRLVWVKVRERVCVKKAATVTPVVEPKTTSLAVHLDPNYTVNPNNPLDLTYSYSASATIGTAPDPNLPAGVLSMYSDGLLICSQNVGGDIDGGTCEVVYSDYGDHTTNVIYDSGTNSVTTGPEVVTIPAPLMPALALAAPTPLPPLPTTTVATLTGGASNNYSPTTCTVKTDDYGDYTEGCAYTITVTVTDANGPVVGGQVEGFCVGVTDTNGTVNCTITLTANFSGVSLAGNAPNPNCATATYTGPELFTGTTLDLPSQSTPLSISADYQCAPTNP